MHTLLCISTKFISCNLILILYYACLASGEHLTSRLDLPHHTKYKGKGISCLVDWDFVETTEDYVTSNYAWDFECSFACNYIGTIDHSVKNIVAEYLMKWLD